MVHVLSRFSSSLVQKLFLAVKMLLLSEASFQFVLNHDQNVTAKFKLCLHIGVFYSTKLIFIRSAVRNVV